VCDLSPHLGHKFTASILGDHDYITYIVDPGDSVKGIKNLLRNFVSSEKLENYTENEPQSKKRKTSPSNTQTTIPSKKTKVTQSTTETQPEMDDE